MTRIRVMTVAALMLVVVPGNPTAPSAFPQTKAQPQTKTPPWELAKAKSEAARKTCQAIADEYLQGKASVDQVHQWSQRWMNAQRDISPKRPEQLSAIEDHIKRMEQLERAAQEKYDSKRGPASDVSAAEYYRLQGQLDLSKAKQSR
jgi:hypothetical protein